MSRIISSSERPSTRPSAISRERRSMTSFHWVSASGSTVLSRLAISWRASNARSCSGQANTSAISSAAMLMRSQYRRFQAFSQVIKERGFRAWSCLLPRMRLRVGLFQISDRETQVALRGGQGAVAQEILDVPQVGVLLNEMGGTPRDTACRRSLRGTTNGC
jgi:hypothetical protein